MVVIYPRSAKMKKSHEYEKHPLLFTVLCLADENRRNYWRHVRRKGNGMVEIVRS